MSDPNEPQTPPPSSSEEPPSSPFPESSLTGQPAPEMPEPLEPSTGGGLWASPSSEPPAPAHPGLSSGDPLAATPPPPTPAPPGSAPAPFTPPPVPAGYTSPPPPGAMGTGPASPPPTVSGGFPSAAPGGSAPAGTGALVLAGWWSRVGAAVIDGLIVLVLAFAIMAPLGIGVFAVDEGDSGGIIALVLGFIVAMFVIAFVALAYAPLLMARTNGQTVGRMVCGIRVVRADGQKMTLGFAALREVAVKALLIGAVAGSITFGFAGLLDVLWPLWDDENRALHDFVVNTRTVVA